MLVVHVDVVPVVQADVVLVVQVDVVLVVQVDVVLVAQVDVMLVVQADVVLVVQVDVALADVMPVVLAEGFVDVVYGCSGCSASSSSLSAPVKNPYTPLMHNYTITLPAFSPRVNPGGVTYPKYYNYDTDHGDPIGVAINGVLIFGHHLKFHSNGTVANIALKRNFDSCGGHGDKKGRYHYHGVPLCLLLNMARTIPSTGNKFMYDTNKETQISRWSTVAKDGPSPILGFALDGFPIYGPYGF